jgi:serine/threonine-protein kinase
MFSQLLSQPPIILNSAKPGLRFSPQLEAVVMRGLSKEPAKRYADVVAFARDFCEAGNAPAAKEKQGLASKFASMFRKKD